ncbi:MAG: glycine cleavage T C-terminal barrel domain-containing protein, partial [Acidimicrobiales bacterium]
DEVLVDGRPIGVMTSGNYSPVLEGGIGLALLVPEVDGGAEAEVDVRGRRLPATVVTPPFVRIGI